MAEGEDVIIAVVVSEVNVIAGNKDWVIDSRATRHICGNKIWLFHLCLYVYDVITTGNNEKQLKIQKMAMSFCVFMFMT